MANSSNRNLSFVLFVCIAFAIIGNNNFSCVNADKEIPETKMFGQKNLGGPTMTFLYCYSCGYRKVFDDYVKIIADKYPQIQVNGDHFDPPGLNMYISKIIFAAKILLIVAIVSSFDIFGTFGMETPNWWQYILVNKLYVCMMIFFVGNMLEGQLVASGAFEITLNDVPVWSKLQTGRIPTPQELFQIIDNQLQFTDKIQENPDFVK